MAKEETMDSVVLAAALAVAHTAIEEAVRAVALMAAARCTATEWMRTMRTKRWEWAKGAEDADSQ